jgi:pseudouridine 5'-phosphatase
VSSLRAVIFDLDGVLLDTEPLYTQATQQVLSPFGKEYTWELKMQMMGRDTQSTAEFLVSALGLPLTAEQYIARRKPLLEQACRAAAALPGAEALVRRLHTRGIPTAVATSGEASLTRAKTAQHPWFELFSVVVCGDDPRLSRPKPAPDIFLMAAQDLGVAPEHCVVFEDSLAGVQAAQAACMQLIAVAAPQMDRSHYPQGIPVVSSLDDANGVMLGLEEAPS